MKLSKLIEKYDYPSPRYTTLPYPFGKNHAVEQPYIEALLQEWRHYQALFGQKALLSELHLGGGTPTFFAPENLEKLLSAILAQVVLASDASMSVEIHQQQMFSKSV